MSQSKSKRSMQKDLKSLNRRVASLSDVDGSMTKLPSAPPGYYRHSSKMETRLNLSDFDEVATYHPYDLLNASPQNSALLLKFATVKFLELDIFATGAMYVIVQFFDKKAYQSTFSGTPIVEGWGTSKAQRFEVLSMNVEGQVTARRISLPAGIRQTEFDVTDKVTPLFTLEKEKSSATASCFVFLKCILEGYAYSPPSSSLSDVRRRFEAANLLGLVRQPPVASSEESGASGFTFLSK